MKKCILSLVLFSLASLVSAQENDLDLNHLRKEIVDTYYGTLAKYYDKRDSLVYEVNYDEAGKITDERFGVAIDKHTYDIKGDRVETRYFDKAMKPVRLEGGPAIIKRKFDKYHRCVEQAAYDGKEKLIKSDFAVFQFKYDENGLLIEEVQLNQNRVPSGDTPIQKYRYDEKRRRIEELFFDKSNNPRKTGGDVEYSVIKLEYSDDDRVIKKTFLNERGELIEGKAVVKIAYDKKPPGRTSVDALESDPEWIQLTYFDKHGNEIDQEYEYVPKKM